MALTKIDDRGLKTPIDLLDNEKIRFGTGNDLQIYHDGNNSYIDHISNGQTLICKADYFHVHEQQTNDYQIRCRQGTVELYFDGSKKLDTAAGGVRVTGNLLLDGDNQYIKLGASDDLQIYHNGTDSYLKNTTNDLYIQNTGDDTYIIATDDIYLKNGDDWAVKCIGDGAVELYYDNAKKLHTFTGGVKFFGTLEADSNDKIKLGDNADLEISHTSNLSTIKNTHANGLAIRSDIVLIQNDAGDHDYLTTANEAGVSLFYDNTKAFSTTQYGVQVDSRGTDSSRIHFATSGHTYSCIGYFGLNRFGIDTHDGLEVRDASDSYATRFKIDSNGETTLYYDNSAKFGTLSVGAKTNGTHYFYGHGQGSNAVTTEIWFNSDNGHHGIHFKGQGTSSNTFAAMKFEISGTGGSYGSISYSTSGTAYNSNSSDRRSKKNFEDWTGSVLPDFKAIKPQLFNYSLEEDSVAKHKGYIAQDNVAAFPEAYPLVDDRYQFNPSGMVHYLMKAVQELTEKVETLETEVAALKAK